MRSWRFRGEVIFSRLIARPGCRAKGQEICNIFQWRKSETGNGVVNEKERFFRGWPRVAHLLRFNATFLAKSWFNLEIGPFIDTMESRMANRFGYFVKKDFKIFYMKIRTFWLRTFFVAIVLRIKIVMPLIISTNLSNNQSVLASAVIILTISKKSIHICTYIILYCINIPIQRTRWKFRTYTYISTQRRKSFNIHQKFYL